MRNEFSSLIQSERDGEVSTYPPDELFPALFRRLTNHWWAQVERGRLRHQDVDDAIQDTAARLWERMGDLARLSRPRAAKLLAWSIVEAWRRIIAERDGESAATVIPDNAAKAVPAEYLSCKSKPADLIQAVRNADDRREKRRKELTERAQEGIETRPVSIKGDARDYRRSDFVIRRRQFVRIVGDAPLEAVSCGLPGDLRMMEAWRRAGTGNGNAVRPVCQELPHGFQDIQVLPGVDVFPGVALFAPNDREDRRSYVEWLMIFAR